MIFLQSFSSIELSKISVEGTQRNVTGFPSYFEDQTIGEPRRRTTTVMLQRGGDSIGILDRKVPVVQEHLDSNLYFRNGNLPLGCHF